MGDQGPLTTKVVEYAAMVRRLVPTVQSPDDWAPLADFVAVEEFERVGTSLEVQDWTQYAEMLTGWASSVEQFETTLRRVSELPGLVYFEVEERHHSGDSVNVVISMSVYAFDEDSKIRHLDVYLQQAP